MAFWHFCQKSLIRNQIRFFRFYPFFRFQTFPDFQTFRFQNSNSNGDDDDDDYNNDGDDDFNNDDGDKNNDDYNYNNDAVDDDDYNNDDDDDALMREVAASCSQSCSAGQICIQIRADDQIKIKTRKKKKKIDALKHPFYKALPK